MVFSQLPIPLSNDDSLTESPSEVRDTSCQTELYETSTLPTPGPLPIESPVVSVELPPLQPQDASKSDELKSLNECITIQQESDGVTLTQPNPVLKPQLLKRPPPTNLEEESSLKRTCRNDTASEKQQANDVSLDNMLCTFDNTLL